MNYSPTAFSRYYDDVRWCTTLCQAWLRYSSPRGECINALCCYEWLCVIHNSARVDIAKAIQHKSSNPLSIKECAQHINTQYWMHFQWRPCPCLLRIFHSFHVISWATFFPLFSINQKAQLDAILMFAPAFNRGQMRVDCFRLGLR